MLALTAVFERLLREENDACGHVRQGSLPAKPLRKRVWAQPSDYALMYSAMYLAAMMPLVNATPMEAPSFS